MVLFVGCGLDYDFDFPVRSAEREEGSKGWKGGGIKGKKGEDDKRGRDGSITRVIFANYIFISIKVDNWSGIYRNH